MSARTAPRDVRVYADLETLSRQAARAVVEHLRAAVGRQGRCSLVLAGGGTPRTLYDLLAHPFADAIPWDRVYLFWGDERYVPPDDPASNYRMAREVLIDHVPIPPSHVHPMPTDADDPKAAARAYEHTLKAWAGDGPFRPDVLLLGMGADGHTASLFPGSSALEERDRGVVATVGPVAPRQRLTLTFPVLNRAATVHVIVSGAAKAEALQGALQHPADPARYPVSGVEPEDGTVTWWVDEAAAGTGSGKRRA